MNRSFASALAVTVAAVLVMAPGRASDPGPPGVADSALLARPADVRPTMVVIGDSISASYSRWGRGDRRAWWSLLADRLEVEPVVLAQGGSGYLRRGARCTGTSFLQRVEAHADEIRAADVVILEGGVNDRFYCLEVRRHGRGDAPSTIRQVDDAVRPTMARVAALVRPGTIVIATAPWGGGAVLDATRESLPAVIERAARDHGFDYVDTATEAMRAAHRTLDGMHPNRRGSSEVAKRVYFRSSLLDR